MQCIINQIEMMPRDEGGVINGDVMIIIYYNSPSVNHLLTRDQCLPDKFL